MLVRPTMMRESLSKSARNPRGPTLRKTQPAGTTRRRNLNPGAGTTPSEKENLTKLGES